MQVDYLLKLCHRGGYTDRVMAGTTEEGLDKASNQEIKSTKYMNKGKLH